MIKVWFRFTVPNNSRKVSFRENLTNPPKNKPRHRNLIFYVEIFYGEFEALCLLNISNLFSVTCFRQRTVIITNFVWSLTWFLWPSLFKKWSHRNFPNFLAPFFTVFFILSQGAPVVYGLKLEWVFFLFREEIVYCGALRKWIVLRLWVFVSEFRPPE